MLKNLQCSAEKQPFIFLDVTTVVRGLQHHILQVYTCLDAAILSHELLASFSNKDKAVCICNYTIFQDPSARL
ncbi:hypothetical protein Y1Q_0015706 [Alligator mississippiensis]|uniref:Uncharacterized protein n=1 Tax=Alligator mississippiensis TaxID=8496 RepID=A0A151NNS1_ALLMI|nr:hypothetical protein Y1Q_0015706 [Alligator mississippiensis]